MICGDYVYQLDTLFLKCKKINFAVSLPLCELTGGNIIRELLTPEKYELVENVPVLDKNGRPEKDSSGKIKTEEITKKITKKQLLDFLNSDGENRLNTRAYPQYGAVEDCIVQPANTEMTTDVGHFVEKYTH